jgi:sugar O-acyltransferase (sialic acid O-acetyltransferase NeuD family)
MVSSRNWSERIPARILLFGKGGHAKVIADEIAQASPFSIITSIDDSDPISQNTSSLASEFPLDRYQVFVAVGDNAARKSITGRLLSMGFKTFVIVSKSACISPQCSLGEGTFVGPMSCINVGARVGISCIVNTAASIDHDCTIGDYVHIAPGCHLCGGVSVGEGTLIGVGTSIIPKAKIGSQIVIAAGSAVNKDLLQDRSLYAGVPAKVKKRLDYLDPIPDEERTSSS